MSIFLVIGLLLVFAVIAWRNLKLALTLILGLLPAYLLRFELAIPWTVLEGFILIAFATWLFGHYGYKLDLRTLGKYRAPLFFLLAMATFATIWAPDQTSALGVWKAYFIEPMLMFVMLRSTFTDRADWMRALSVLSLTAIAIALFAIFQAVTGLGLPIPWDVERRATSVFEYPNAVGLFVAPIIAASAVMVASLGRKYRMGIAMAAGAAFGIIAIILAETEAALVAIPAALLITLFMSGVGTKTKIVTLIGSTMLVTIMLAAVPTVREKILLQDYSGGVRRAQWGETIELIKDRPLHGAGLSGYPTVFEPYHDPTLYEIFQFPHNVILNFWVEMGVFGVVAFLWIAGVTAKVAWMRRDDALVLAAFAALLTMTIHGLVDVPFFKNDLAVLTAFFLAMILAPTENHPGHPEVTKG